MDEQLFLHTVVGTIVSSILFGVLGGPLLGGGIAGYLEGGSRSDGVKVGIFVGVGTLIVVGSGFLLTNWLTFGTDVPPLAGVLGDSVVFVLLFGSIYSIGLSVVGSLGGGYVFEKQEARA